MLGARLLDTWLREEFTQPDTFPALPNVKIKLNDLHGRRGREIWIRNGVKSQKRKLSSPFSSATTRTLALPVPQLSTQFRIREVPIPFHSFKIYQGYFLLSALRPFYHYFKTNFSRPSITCKLLNF